MQHLPTWVTSGMSTVTVKHLSSSPRTVVVDPGSGFTIDDATGEILDRPDPDRCAVSRFERYLSFSEAKLLSYVGRTEEEFCELQSERRASRAVTEIPAPQGGWKAEWRRLGQASASSYLEQKAKTHKNEFEPGRAGYVCAGRAPWANRGECAAGEHEIAAAVVCGREWCPRCGQNASPGVEGSRAHRRRIARWLPKAMQLEQIGEWVFTYPLALRDCLRNVRELAEDGKSLKRALQHRGYHRGLRRLHWFGEPENGVNGVPRFHPHHNVLTDSGYVPSSEIEAVKEVWRRLLKRRYGYTGPINARYQFATMPAQKYHRVRYVTRATFLNLDWDQQLGDEIMGFRNASTWGKWEGPAVWQPEPSDQAPSLEAQKLASGQCPGGHTHPVAVEYAGVQAAARLVLESWQDAGEGFYWRRKRQFRPSGSVGQGDDIRSKNELPAGGNSS